MTRQNKILMQFNHRYFLDYCLTKLPSHGRILDFGCGKGEMVAAGREMGMDFYGTDIFYKDGRTRLEVEKKGLMGTVVREISLGKLDFPDAFFDMVVSNQVFEHVSDLDTALSEISRVLKPSGELHTLFPVRETWWEGHFGIPFLHNFPPDVSYRIAYAMFWRSLGMGYHHAGRTIREWAEYVCNWIDQYTSYRSKLEIVSLLEKYFHAVSLDERDYLHYRISNSNIPFKKMSLGMLRNPLFGWVFRNMYFRRGGIVVTAKVR